MKRLSSIVRVCAVVAAVSTAIAVRVIANPGGEGSARFHLVETDIDTIQKAVQTGLITSEQLVRMYLNRIAAYDTAGPHLNSYLYQNPHALAVARAEDGARHPGK